MPRLFKPSCSLDQFWQPMLQIPCQQEDTASAMLIRVLLQCSSQPLPMLANITSQPLDASRAVCTGRPCLHHFFWQPASLLRDLVLVSRAFARQAPVKRLLVLVQPLRVRSGHRSAKDQAAHIQYFPRGLRFCGPPNRTKRACAELSAPLQR